MEWHPVFRVGRMRLQVSFTGGHLCGGACTSASYETSDPVVQKVIESSKAFGSGRIYVAAVAEEAPSAKKKVVSHSTVMEFDDIDKASDFLQHEKGIPLERIITLDECVAEARRLGIDLKIRS